MPWHIGQSAECDGIAVIKDDDGSVAGCHETEEAAKAQMAALYASEGDVTETELITTTTTNTPDNGALFVPSTAAPIDIVSIPSIQEVDTAGLSLGALTEMIRSAFDAKYRQASDVVPVETEAYYWTRDIFIGHPLLGDAMVVEHQGKLFVVPFSLDGDTINFEEPWDEVRITYEKVPSGSMTEAALTEASTGHAIAIEEAQIDNGRIVPLTLDIAVIEPGPGNPADNHYYPAEVLRRDAGVFKEAKMFTSDHQDDKNVRQWVSTIQNCPVGFTESGAPIARVVVHDEPFAKTLLALNESKLLHKMECSILGAGKATKQEIDEHEYNVVEAITAAEAVDWVTRAGAGGRALAIAESDAPALETEDQMDENEKEEEIQEAETVTLKEDETETGEQPQETEPEAEETESEPEGDEDEQEPTEAALSAESVTEIFKESGLGEDAIGLLAARPYVNEQDVKDAVEQFKQLIKRATGSGQPFAQGATMPVQESTEEREKRGVDSYRAIKEKWGSAYNYRVED